jgi:poly(A) polymerase
MADLRLKPSCSRDDALMVLRRLRDSGHIAYFAGGCVRDLLLGHEPKDYDVATDAPPKRVRELFSNTQAVGQAFGVILVRQGKSIVEVATFRSDGTYTDGRRPDHVTFSTLQEDAQRRDFTINGLFLDPLDGDRIVDFVGGRADVQGRVLRAIGDPAQRFAEDHLRLLRAVRFAARFGLTIDLLTSQAIARDADLLKRISPERIADELRLMLTPGTRQAAYELLWRFNLPPVLLRFLIPPPRPVDPAKSVVAAFSGSQISFGLALAGIVLDAKWPDLPDRPAAMQSIRALRQSLKISNEESDVLEGILLSLPMLLAGEYPRVAGLKRFLAQNAAGDTRIALDALLALGQCSTRIEQLKSHLSDLEKGDYAPVPLLTGDDLQKIGLCPGPIFKHLLQETYDAQLEGRISSAEEAIALAKSLADQSGHS